MSNEKFTWSIPGGRVQRLSEAAFSAEHTLIAGTTGSGKSVLLNGMIRDLLRLYAPGEASLVLIDPKAMELEGFRCLPHTIGYTDTEQGAERVLRQVLELMARRNRYCKEHGLRRYNGGAVYVVIDELHPLATGEHKKTFRRLLSLLLTQARAANIHIIAATQIPNRASLPADIVSLFTLRIGLGTMDGIESKQIIGIKGCEELPPHGLALVRYNRTVQAVEIPMTDEAELMKLVSYWTEQNARRSA